ncbi:major capsid protein [Dipodfec virus UA23Rod_1363]|uniref:Major capsid protein n=1 Tax=Dipodfec virus UA23Rod_1363 TaxID=2929331 RepID=A0A976R5F3_9VIRU|nr:major capsid protein [Dipodfec virus UA23Rod_1363]
MANLFNSIPLKAPKLNSFNLSHDVKLTCEMGQLIPIMMEPVLPSDRFKVSSEHLVRFAPLQSPIMSDVDVYVHYFFVPNRLIWNKWETFITGSENGKKIDDANLPISPRVIFSRNAATMIPTSYGGVGVGSFAFLPKLKPLLQHCSLADYLGFQTYSNAELSDIATGVSTGLGYELDELPFRAYQRVWFDYFRDENLSNAESFFTNAIPGSIKMDGVIFDHPGTLTINSQLLVNQVSGLMSLRQRAWRKDYFTSALPWAQKGDDVLLPSSSSIAFNDNSTAALSRINNSRDFVSVNAFQVNTGSPVVASTTLRDNTGQNVTNLYSTSSADPSNLLSFNFSHFGLKGSDLNSLISSGSASDSTIRELRRAFAAQAFLERRAVGGSRYNEQILAFFGVKTSDGRLQRAEFLGGSRQPVVVSQVLQTSESTADSPLAEPAGTAVSAGGKFIFDRQFEEYGFIVGLLSVMPRANYMQGIPRKYLKKDVYDYYWPQFARIGEQEILNQELYSEWGSEYNDKVFGYSPRYSEYRFINSRVHGDFKDTLSYWHLGRDFDGIQALNEQFITCRPSSRIFAYEGQDFNHLWVDIHINCRALRPIPKYSESL